MDGNGFTIHVPERHLEWLREMTRTYDVRDEQKAIRVLFEYAIQEGDAERIFTKVRCGNC